MKTFYNKVKNVISKLSLAWHIIRSAKNLVLTSSVFHSSIKNIDILGDTNPYMCFENAEGGYDICYVIPWNGGRKYFTITIARYKGANAGQIVDTTLDILNNHSIPSSMITGDSTNQSKPTNYIPYTNNVNIN